MQDLGGHYREMSVSLISTYCCQFLQLPHYNCVALYMLKRFILTASYCSWLYAFFIVNRVCWSCMNKDYVHFTRLGCEDIIVDSVTIDNMINILQWSSEPYGSDWVHRQTLHFLKEEFVQVAHSSVLCELSKEYLIETISSDYLQVRIELIFQWFVITWWEYFRAQLIVFNRWVVDMTFSCLIVILAQIIFKVTVLLICYIEGQTSSLIIHNFPFIR